MRTLAFRGVSLSVIAALLAPSSLAPAMAQSRVALDGTPSAGLCAQFGFNGDNSDDQQVQSVVVTSQRLARPMPPPASAPMRKEQRVQQSSPRGAPPPPAPPPPPPM